MAGKVSEDRPHSVNDESLKRSVLGASERGYCVNDVSPKRSASNS